MNLKRQRFLAGLLVAATLTAPATALADSKEAPTTEPMPAVTEQKPEGKGPAVPLAEIKVTREEAIAIATKALAIPADMGAPNVSISQSKTYAGWELNWQTKAKTPNPRSMTVMVNAVTGQIMHYWYNNPAANEAPLSYSRSEAYKVAAEWLAKLVPDQKEALRYVDNPLEYGFYGGNATFQFHWDRMEKGYPVNGQGVDITISARTGEMQNYSFSWTTDLTFDLPETILDKAAAEAAYSQQLPMQMIYRYYQKPATEIGEWKLVYRPMGGSFPIFNQEGKPISYNGEVIDYTKYAEPKLIPATAQTYEKPAKPLTAEEALAMAQELTGQTEAPTNMDCREYGQEETKEYSCNFNWYTEPSGPYVNLSIDLNTGLVNHYSNWGQEQSEKFVAKYTAEQAKQIAIQFIQKFRPDMAGNALMTSNHMYEEKMMMAGEQMRSYHFTFAATHEYIPVYGWDSNMEVDAATGAIRYFYGNNRQENAKAPFPALTDLIKAGQAIESFLKHQGIELTWVTVSMPARPVDKMAAEAKQEQPKVSLVWAPRRVLGMDVIDAKTGVPYDYSGRDLIEGAKRPIDIEGHAAQREIELLWARGIFELKDGKFNPDQTVSAAELARWFVLSRGLQPYPMYDFAMNFTAAGRGMAGENLAKAESAAYFGAALQAGIMMPEDFENDADPNAPVTRELAALWAVRGLGYGDIAKMEIKIEMPFEDKASIGAKYANSAALLYGLKIHQGDAQGNFNPQQIITRGDAAKLLFAVASKARYYW